MQNYIRTRYPICEVPEVGVQLPEWRVTPHLYRMTVCTSAARETGVQATHHFGEPQVVFFRNR